VQRFAFVAAPTSATGEFLLAQLAGAERAGDAEFRQATLFPLGTVTGRVPDAWLAERMHTALVAHAQHEDDSLRAAAVGGLGNAGRADDLRRLLAALEDEHGGVRVEAAAGLRTRVTPETTGALLGALADEDPAVASRALVVLRKHHFEGAADPALVERARLGQYNGRLHRAMASTLVGSRDQPEVRAALARGALERPTARGGPRVLVAGIAAVMTRRARWLCQRRRFRTLTPAPCGWTFGATAAPRPCTLTLVGG